MKRFFLLSALVAAGFTAAEASSPYAGKEDREIKTLSEAKVEGYVSGKGMGQAMAAELNGYPGPRHVLDLADDLELTAEQQVKIQAIFDHMHVEAMRLGKRIVERERELDRAFARGDMDERTLDSILKELGKLKARLRYTHLQAHLDQRALMKDEQIEAYRKLRGYGASSDNQSHSPEHR